MDFLSGPLAYAACGGLILGAACSINYVIRGKDTGMTRIAFNLTTMKKQEIPEMLAMLGGMFTMSSIFYLVYGNGNYNGFQPFGPDQDITMWTTMPGFLIAGLLIGFGAKLGGGCTSGHGLCGLPRFSLRSFVAVCMFLLAGIGVSTYAVNFGLGPLVQNAPKVTDKIHYNHRLSATAFLIIGAILPIFGLFYAKTVNKKALKKEKIIDQFLVYFIGNIFAAGLLVSGMSRRANVLGFLQLNSHWNPALLFVLGCGVGINLISFAIMRKRGVSLNGNKVFNPVDKDSKVDWRVLLGGFCFGLGWGLGGICPGPFYVLFSVFTIPIQVLWGSGFVLGAIAGSKLQQKTQPSTLEKVKQALNIKSQ